MSEQITRAQLAKARPENVVRLAKALHLRGCACGATACQRDVVENVARELERQSMQMHEKEARRG